MKKYRFLINKYTITLAILLILAFADLFLHKGITRAILPVGFTDKFQPQPLKPLATILTTTSKTWIKGINTISLMEQIPASTAGMECDVYFNTELNYFQVYHDSDNISTLNADTLLTVYKKRNLSGGLWLDFKNLTAANARPALAAACYLRDRYGLQGKMIIESCSLENLRLFADSGFFTSFYIPMFNPYLMAEDSLVKVLNVMADYLRQYPVSALSGYYFQYPAVKKYFPLHHYLTWMNKPGISPVANILNNRMMRDDKVKVVLYSK